jgi:transcriptional regulator with XRE-family HTH domain
LSRPERELHPSRSALHRFGYELRSWRKERGLSQARLGAAVHVSGDLIYKIELAERRAGKDLAARCDRILEAFGALMRLWDAVEEEERNAGGSAVDADNRIVGISSRGEGMTPFTGVETITVEMLTLAGKSVPVSIDRRTFVAGAAAALPLVGWPGRGPGAASAYATADGYVSDVIRVMADLRTSLAAQDNVLGPAVAAPAAIQQIATLQELSKGADYQAREALMGLQSAYAEFTGWLADDLGDRRAGGFWIDRALEWAHEADDELIIGYVLARKAQRAAESGDAGAAISLARAAQRRGSLTCRVRAAAIQYEAQGHALAGDTTEFRRAIDQAAELVAATPPSAAREWAPWCTPGYVIMYEAAGWTRLGQPDRAIPAYERGLTGWSDEFRRDQGMYRGRLAGAYASAGEPERAASVGSEALIIACRTGSARVLAELEPLPKLLEQWGEVPAVRAFNDDLRQAQNPPALTT